MDMDSELIKMFSESLTFQHHERQNIGPNNIHLRYIDGKPNDLVHLLCELYYLADSSKVTQTVCIFVSTNEIHQKISKYLSEQIHCIKEPINIQIIVEQISPIDLNISLYE